MGKHILIILASIVLAACAGRPHSSQMLYVQKQQLLPQLSAASGLVLFRFNAIIASDDANGFFVMDTQILSPKFYPFEPNTLYKRKAKIDKLDFEAAELIKWNDTELVVAISSGTLPITREKILVAEAASPQIFRLYEASNFYKQLKEKANIKDADFNLEGLFATKDSLFIINRGDNNIVIFSTNDFMAGLQNGFGQPLPVRSLTLSLPCYKGNPITLSGADYWRDGKFVFTASMENTTDWLKDGEVLGSFVGIANLDGKLVSLHPFRSRPGTMHKAKLESIVVAKEEQNHLKLYAVSDNDDGQSTWYEIKMKIK